MATDTATETVIHRFVWHPSESVFKQKANEHATCTTIRCRLPSCPLLAVRSCTFVPVFGWHKCPYGSFRTETGPTKRARSCWKWCNDRKAEFPDVGTLGYPAKKLAFIGDYVYLPYAHMDMNEAAPFLAHSRVFVSGTPFLPREHWTIATVLAVLDFRPRAMMGGEITSYQREEVPKFLAHLREVDAAMWGQLVKERPELDTAPNYVGRTALLRTLNHPIEWSTGHASYPVRWRWDGTRVTTTSKHAYSSTWGKMPLETLELAGTPKEKAEVVVKDNAWVNEGTVFVD